MQPWQTVLLFVAVLLMLWLADRRRARRAIRVQQQRWVQDDEGGSAPVYAEVPPNPPLVPVRRARLGDVPSGPRDW